MLRYAKQTKSKDFLTYFLIATGFLIGLGSMAWHFWQTTPTLLLDILPVFVFIMVSLFVILYKLYGNYLYALGLLMLGFFIIPIFQALTNLRTNGPPFYGILAAFVYILIVVCIKDKEVFKKLFIPIGFFFLATFFRQIDLYACDFIPFGTHLLWHFFNSFAMYYIFRLVLKSINS